LTPSAGTWSTPDRQLALILGQIFFTGIGLSWWCVVGNALFVTHWGAERIPWAFLVGAVCGPLIAFGVIALQRRWSTARVTLTISALLAAFIVLVWLGLLTPLAGWVSLFLMASYALSLQMTYISLGALTARLFDIRQTKRFFPRIGAAFSFGFIVGSFTVPPLLTYLGGTADLLIGAGIALLVALLFRVLLIGANRAVLAAPVRAHTGLPPQPLHHLLRQRYIARTFGFQALTAINSRLLIFLITALVATRFTTAESLAGFYGPYMGVRDSTTVLFALLAAGWLLNRFGLALGLALNPMVIGVLIALTSMASLFLTLEHELVFWLVIATVALFTTFYEGMTIPALKTVYQALPPQERQVVETAVEGIGVPVAYGFAGIVLLAYVAIPGLTLIHLLFFTLLLMAAWLVCSVLVYRDYARTLVRSLSRRALNQAELSLEDGSSLAVVERLLQSANIGEVRLALDLLEQADHSTLPAQLAALVERGSAEIQIEALLRIAHHRVTSALPAVERSLRAPAPPQVQGAALRAFCALTESDPVETVAPFLAHAEPCVRLGVLTGLLRDGGVTGILRAGEQLTALLQAPEPAQRALAAQVIGEVGVNHFYQPLLPLLVDNNLDVRRAALSAAQRVTHPRLLPLLVGNLGMATLRSAAITALTASGELVLPLVDQELTNATKGKVDTARRLVRVCAQIKGPTTVALLQRHLNHPNSELQSQVLLALQRCGYQAEAGERAQLEALLRNAGRRGLLLLLARQEIGQGISEEPATASLSTALTEEFRIVRQRVFLLLALLYDARALLRAADYLARGSRAEQALALEMLDVTLTAQEKMLLLPLLDESRPLAQRLAALQQQFPLPGRERAARLAEIITDTATWPLPWTRACAIYAAGKLGLHNLAGAIQAALPDEDPVVQETATWALAHLRSKFGLHTATRHATQPEFGATTTPVLVP
jgi:ATP:ADP antiporter, AAA family